MFPSLASEVERATLLIEHEHPRLVGIGRRRHLPDPGYANVRRSGELVEPVKRRLRSREQELVVVAARECPREDLRIATDRRARGRRERNRVCGDDCVQAGDRAEMVQVGDESVGHVDARGCDSDEVRTERHARLRQPVALEQEGSRVGVERRPRLSQHAKSERGVTDRSGHEDEVSGTRPAAADDSSHRRLAQSAHGDHDGT
ncbi:MAG TPA: hypothetical protein VGI35_08715 [Steroidobacteraceae bacterium]